MRIRFTLITSACALSVLVGCGSTDTAEPIAPSVPPLPTVSSVPRTTTPAPTTTTAAPTTTTTVPPTTTTTEPVADIAVDPDVYADVDRPYVPAPVPFVAPAPVESGPSLDFPSCKAAKAAGAGPFYKGGPGYRPKLDGDGDGIACDAN